MSWLAVCTSFGEEYSVIQSHMVEREEVSAGRPIRSCRGLYQDTPIELILMGAGQKGVQKLESLDWSEYIGFLHLGFCGGLAESVGVGDLVLPTMCLSLNADPIELEELHLILKSPKKVHDGALVTVEKLIRTRNEKLELHRQTKAVAVDMETHAFATSAIAKGLSVIALKAVADALGDDLPEFEPPFDRESMKEAKLASPDLTRRWRENMELARASLTVGAEQLVPALHQIWSF